MLILRPAVALVAIGLAVPAGSPAVPAGSPVPSLALPRSYPVSQGISTRLALGDLNGDRRLDVVANGYPGGFSVLVNRRNGTFSQGHHYRAAAADLAVADVNEDGRPDVVGASEEAVSVLLNRGGGVFGSRRDYVTRKSFAVAVGDLNGDGPPDVVTANALAGRVSVLLNRGDGRFGGAVTFGTAGSPVSIAIGDVDGDGRPDVVSGNAVSKSVSVLRGLGDGTFRPHVDYRSADDPLSVSLADLDGNGALDLVTGNYSAPNTVSVLLNRGDGTFRAHRDYRAGGWGNFPDRAAIGDVNSDGRPDVVVANQDIYGDDNSVGIVSVLINAGGGTLRKKRDFFQVSHDYEGLALGDLNADGRLDVAIADDDGLIDVRLNATGACGVPRVTGLALPAATRAIRRAGCRLGIVRTRRSGRLAAGHVLGQAPGYGIVRPRNARVGLVVSRR